MNARCATNGCRKRAIDGSALCWPHKSDYLKVVAREIVSTGRCPDCRSPLKRNLALAGWWQCVCYGRADFRPAEYREAPSCHFQTFTE